MDMQIVGWRMQNGLNNYDRKKVACDALVQIRCKSLTKFGRSSNGQHAVACDETHKLIRAACANVLRSCKITIYHPALLTVAAEAEATAATAATAFSRLQKTASLPEARLVSAFDRERDKLLRPFRLVDRVLSGPMHDQLH